MAENRMYVTTPPVNETAHLTVKLELIDGSRIFTSFTFDYRHNPVVTDIRPRSHLTV